MVKSEHWSNEYHASPIIHPPLAMDPSTKLAVFDSESSSNHFGWRYHLCDFYFLLIGYPVVVRSLKKLPTTISALHQSHGL